MVLKEKNVDCFASDFFPRNKEAQVGLEKKGGLSHGLEKTNRWEGPCINGRGGSDESKTNKLPFNSRDT